MLVELAIVCIAIVVASMLIHRVEDRREFERHTITPEALHALMTTEHEVFVVDVRQPLDLLADSEIIPGAIWISPQQLIDDPSLLPRGRDLIVYCTCPSDRTSRIVLHRALAMGFSRIKLLRGGLDGWRANGYPVEQYVKPFRLNSSRSEDLAAAS